MVVIRRNIRVNERIRIPQVRLIGPGGKQLGIVPTKEALDMAAQNELDLVEVAPQASPPVCRIMDFSKFKYEQEKKEREAKKHQHRFQLKEIRVKPNIDEHDYQVKLRHLIEFLKKKHKVKVNLFFRGRQMAHRDIGRRIIDKFIQDSAQDGQLESNPSMEGRTLSVVIAPK